MNSTFLRKYSIIIVLFSAFLVLVYKINKPFIGHHDFNGVFYGNFAKNTAKFGFLKTKFGAAYTFLPKSEDELKFYTNYPPMYQLFLGLTAVLFGVDEVSLRLLSIVFSLLAVYYFYKLAIELFSKKTAFIASLFFILNPMFIYYGKMPINEIIGLPLVIFSFLNYFNFFKNSNKKNLYLLIVSLVLACQAVWSAYYLVPLFIAHYLTFKNKDKLFKRKKIIYLILIPFTCFLSHMLYTYILTRTFTNSIFRTMLFRMQLGKKAIEFPFTLTQYIKQEALWLTVFYTKILSLLSLIYVFYLVGLLFKKKFGFKHGFLLLIFVFPFIDTIIFKNVCYIHDYKLIYFLISLPLLGSASLFYLIDRYKYLWKKNNIVSFSIIIFVLFFFSIERISFTKTLLSSSMNKIAYDLGIILKKELNEDGVALIGSLSFGDFYTPFLNYYGQRKVVYFKAELDDYKKIFSDKVKVVVFVKGREEPADDLADHLKQYQYSKTKDFEFYYLK